MARGPIPFTVVKTNGDTAVGVTAQVNLRGGGLATVYATESGGSTIANPMLTDSAGQIPGWLDEGSYDITTSGFGITTVMRGLEILKGGGSFAQAPLSITTTKIVDANVTYNKIATGAVDSSHIQDGVVTNAKLVTPTTGVWRTVMKFMGWAAPGVSTTPAFYNNTLRTATPIPGTGGGVQGLWGFNTASDYQVAGKTTRFRMKVSYFLGASPGVVLDWQLYPITSPYPLGGAGGVGIQSVGGPIFGSEVIANPLGANTGQQYISSGWDISAMTAGQAYVVLVFATGAMVTNGVSSMVTIEMRHT